PLYGITGIVESLIDGAAGELTEAAKQNLAMVATRGRRLGHLVGDILDFSKLRHKSLELDRRPVELHALVDVVLTLSGGLIGSKNLQLVNSVAADLPAADADENRLQQILYNLVGNAIKFTEAGRVEVSAALEGDRLVIRVADTGIGIPKDKQEKIFEVFEQGDARVEREYGGTGLGLALTRQLVELHGGALGVESAPGAGSTFSFSLPMAAEAAATTAAATARAAQRHPVRPEPEPPAIEISTALATRVAGESGTSGPRVLVVDDEPVNLQVVRNYLAVEAFDLTLASSGEQALRLLAEEKFDLVLLDVMMPRVSGYEVCRSLRANHSLSDLPVIFLTAKNQDSDVVTGLALGANDYLTKPISKDRLLARVRPHLELLHVHRNLEDLVDEKMAEVTVLEGLLPICAHCKKIRDDENNWRQLEDYIDRHSEASFSHGICPDCFERYVKQSSGTRAPELP
ncbi:MAG: response regulator, partial [Acidobacteriota bacterium]